MLQKLKNLDLFKQRPFFMFSSSYSIKRKKSGVNDNSKYEYGSWPGACLSSILICVLLAKFFDIFTKMMNFERDIFDQYQIKNNFKGESSLVKMSNYAFVPNL